MEDIVLREKVAHLEERAKSNTHRIDNLEEKVEDIHELASSVKLLASETKAMREDVNNTNDRLQQLEEKPLKEYEDTRKKIKDKALMFVLGIIFTYIALKLRTRKFYIERRKIWNT